MVSTVVLNLLVGARSPLREPHRWMARAQHPTDPRNLNY